MNISRFEEFAPVLKNLPSTFALDQPMPKALHLESEGSLSIFYAPFDHVSETARIVLVGITPGRAQAIAALTSARERLRSGASLTDAAAYAKNAASFAGPMRANLVSMLDHIGVAALLGLSTTGSLWSSHSHLVHFTSAVRYPVFDAGKNYSGAGLTRQGVLRRQLDRYFIAECNMLPDALFVPLGPAALSACEYAQSAGALRDSQLLRGLPHPSGANAERIAYFLGRKARGALSGKTQPDAIDEGRSAAMRCVEAWARRDRNPAMQTPPTHSFVEPSPLHGAAPKVLTSHARATKASGAPSLPNGTKSGNIDAFDGERAKEVLDKMFVPLRAPTKKIAAYRTRNGLQIAVERTVRTPLVWLEKLPPGMIFQVVNPENPGQPYGPNQSRHSNLKQQAPNLAMGEKAYKVAVPDRTTLIDLANAYAAISRRDAERMSSKRCCAAFTSEAPGPRP